MTQTRLKYSIGRKKMFKLDEIFRYSPDGGGGNPPAQEPPVVKTFVQQDVDAIVESRLAKERTKICE